MSFCKKSFHSFLALPNSNNNGTFESLMSSRPAHITAAATAKTDPGEIGFVDQVGGGGGGRLTLCTESLGFESMVERGMEDPSHDKMNGGDMSLKKAAAAAVGSRWKRVAARTETEVKRFPPPLSSLGRNGKPTFFLRPVRNDGRLELKEVEIDRHEILCASRQDRRLRLHVIENEEFYADVEEKTETEDDAKTTAAAAEEVEEEAKRSADWWFPVKKRRTTAFAATKACMPGVNIV